MANRIQIRRDTEANWTASNPVLAQGELAYSTNGAKAIKVGDGTTAWLSLPAYDAGKVAGPASATDNAIARFDGTTGKLVQNSSVLIDDSGNTTFVSGTFGYGSGAGGTVTQATSKSTAVTLNKPSGQITTNNAALAAGAEVQFLVNNSTVSDSDTVIVNQAGYTINTSNYQIRCAATANGSFAMNLKNISAISLSEAVPINFAIIKGSTT